MIDAFEEEIRSLDTLSPETFDDICMRVENNVSSRKLALSLHKKVRGYQINSQRESQIRLFEDKNSGFITPQLVFDEMAQQYGTEKFIYCLDNCRLKTAGYFEIHYLKFSFFLSFQLIF